MPQIGFLGAGRMATALAQGFVASGIARPDELIASDISPVARELFAAALGARVTAENAEVLASAEVIIISLKPLAAHDALMALRDQVQARHVFISIVAGLTLQRLHQLLGLHTRLIRVMPNTPAQVGAGAAGYALSSTVLPGDGELVQRLLQSSGLAVQIPEHLLDAVTGLSGSGPAYAFQIIEALSDGGVRVGLPRDVATRLAAQTLLGAARMVLETQLHPGALKDMVTSPGGTTIAGLHELERGGLRAALMNAVQAATARAQELGQS